MPRSCRTGELVFDAELEKTVKAIRRAKKLENQLSGSQSESSRVNCEEEEEIENSTASEFEEEAEEEMGDNLTLRQLAAPNVDQQSLCIVLPETTVPFNLKSGTIHLLPKFHGFAGEDPHKHLKEFQVVCSTVKQQGVSEERVQLQAFPFSLDSDAKSWLYELPANSIATWNEMKRQFLDKYFPASRTSTMRKDICGIRQSHGETLHEYWERFKRLCNNCPHHQIPEQLLLQYFYEGLTENERNKLDAASGGAMMNKTPAAARQLISVMAETSKQYTKRADTATQRVSEVSDSSTNQRLDELTSLVRKMAAGQLSQVQTCGLCYMMGHPTDMCPTLQDDSNEHVNAVGGPVGQPHRRYDPYSNTYNPGWRDHPNFSYGNRQQGFQQQSPSYQPPHMRQPYQAPQASSAKPGMSLEEIVHNLANNTQNWQQEAQRFQQDAQRFQ